MAETTLHGFPFTTDTNDTNGQPVTKVGNVVASGGNGIFTYSGDATGYLSETIVEATDIGNDNFQITLTDCSMTNTAAAAVLFTWFTNPLVESFYIISDLPNSRIALIGSMGESRFPFPDGFDCTQNHTYVISRYNGIFYVTIDGQLLTASQTGMDNKVLPSFLGGTFYFGSWIGTFNQPTVTVADALITTLTTFEPPKLATLGLVVFNDGAAWSSMSAAALYAGNFTAEMTKMGAALLFTIDIPDGSTIASATLSMTPIAPTAGSGTHLYIVGAKNSTSPTYPVDLAAYQAIRGTDCGGASDTNRTTAQVDWSADFSTLTPQTSPDLKTVVQEIVDSTSGDISTLLIFVDDHDNRSAVGNAVASISVTLNLTFGSAPSTYTITYDGNGNTTGTAPTGGTYDPNATITVSSIGDLARTNCNFLEWNTSADGSGTGYDPAETFIITGNTTLYAIWGRHFLVNDVVRNNNDTYWCKVEHDASAASEPGVGASWETYWGKGVDLSGKADKVSISPDPTGYVATFDDEGNLAVSDRQVATDLPPDPTAANDFIVATGSPAVWNKKTLEETKTILGVGSAIHNNLEGLDGGSASPEEYYHLDSADYNALTDANAQLEQLQIDGSPTFEFVKSKIKEIYKTQSSESPLTVAQCKRTIVSNYGMTDADCAITLPAAEEGLAFICILPAVRARYFRLVANTGDKIYLSGTAGTAAGYVGVASGYATGSACQMFTFKASDGGFDWFCLPIFGTWVAG